MYPYQSGPVYGGSQYNPATGAESRDLRPLSSSDPRYNQRLDMMGGMGGGMRPTNKLPPGFEREPQISEPLRPPDYYTQQTGGVTPPPFEDSGPVTFSTRPMRIKQPEQQVPDRIDFDDYFNGTNPNGGNLAGPGVMPPEGVHGYPANQQQMQRPMRGYGQQMQQMQRPMGGFGGYGQQMQQMNPFMGGQGFNPMGGGFGGYGQQMQQMNPFMGGGGFGGFGGFGQQMNPFMGGQGFNPMGGGFGGFGQQMNPFMGGQGFNPMGGGFGGFGGFGQQMQNPFMGGQGFNPMGGGFGQQMQQPMQQRAQPQQQQAPMAPMGYQGGAF
jgi:hypothetical protein